MGFDKRQYEMEYHKNNYERVIINVPKGLKGTLLKPLAEDHGISLNQLFIQAVEDKYDVRIMDFKTK